MLGAIAQLDIMK
jgi:hypothetical protein